MPKALVWDQTGSRYYETGDSKAVLYLQDETGSYAKGIAWNGLTAFTESPSGADATDFYADNIKYASIRAAETFGATIEAYTYPDEFAECDGSVEVAPGVYAGQQTRKAFGFSVRTEIGNDVSSEAGYKLHLVYGATASPSDRSYQTINDSPDAISFSWEITTNPVSVSGLKPTACLTIDSRKADADKLAALEKVLYGSDEADARLPLPDEVATMMKTTA